MKERMTFALAGCGHLGKIVADAYKQGLVEPWRLVGAYSHKAEDARLLVQGTDAQAVPSCRELVALKPDFLVETASISLLQELAPTALLHGISLIPLSIGAFADEAFYSLCVRNAEKGGARILIPSGCVGGFDVLRTVTLMGQVDKSGVRAGISTRKGPRSLKNTPLYADKLETESREVFHGTTKEAIALLPTKVNVAVATALATSGPSKTASSITSVPGFVGDDHLITIQGPGVEAKFDIYSATSDIAGWSVVALMRNMAGTVQFF